MVKCAFTSCPSKKLFDVSPIDNLLGDFVRRGLSNNARADILYSLRIVVILLIFQQKNLQISLYVLFETDVGIVAYKVAM